ncbi:MAG: DinB family protein [Terriglobales bacterium]
MQETTQQYKQRVLGYVGAQEPLRVLAATARKLQRLVAGATPRRLTRPPAADKWSAAQILAHLADTEIVLGYRYRSVAGQPGRPLAAYDQEAWASAMDYARRPAKRSLQAFAAVRAANLGLLKALRPEQWKLEGVHAERGPESIAVIARLAAGHDLNHLLQLEAILKS